MQHDYTKPPDSIYLAIARLRFPNWDITGAGPIAVVLKCCRKMVLCTWPLQAQTVRAESCGTYCQHSKAPSENWHYFHVLNEEPKHSAPVKAHWACEIEVE